MLYGDTDGTAPQMPGIFALSKESSEEADEDGLGLGVPLIDATGVHADEESDAASSLSDSVLLVVDVDGSNIFSSSSKYNP
jgi:hypothetical protein